MLAWACGSPVGHFFATCPLSLRRLTSWPQVKPVSFDPDAAELPGAPAAVSADNTPVFIGQDGVVRGTDEKGL